VAEARALYRALGLDPTKTRPSSEALLRRVLKGGALYRVNTLVDAVNLVSLRRQLPFGLYDLERIEPPVTLRLGGPGESYPGIRKGDVNVGGRPVLADATGAFGNPSADSERTSIRLETTRALVIAWAPARLAVSELGAALDDAAETAIRHCGGERVERRLLPDAGA
jgi:DNA/RNA-binding domain of Phe-tRNA-synthetase-like protein